jgi:hypothetical protein
MRIVTADLSAGSLEPCDIEVPLGRLASSPDRRAAARWQMLLCLVQVLRSECRYPEVWGAIVGDVLHLQPDERQTVCARVWADAPDYGPVRDGLPALYYRVQVTREGTPLSTDLRTERPEEVARLLEQAFGGLG